MKIRTGFVSNSSSSSFAIYGIGLNAKEIPEKFRCDQGVSRYKDYFFPGVDFIYSDQEGFAVIGRAMNQIGDNETGKQFKDSTKLKLDTLFGKDFMASHQCEYHIEEYEY